MYQFYFISLDEEDEGDAVAEEEEEKLPDLSLVEIYARRAHKLQQRQAAIASMSCAVVENPEENVSTAFVIIVCPSTECQIYLGFPGH